MKITLRAKAFCSNKKFQPRKISWKNSGLVESTNSWDCMGWSLNRRNPGLKIRELSKKWTQCYEAAARFDPGFKNRRIFLQQINKPAARFEEKKINSEHKSYEAANQNVLFTLIPKMRTYLDALMLNIRFSWILEINNSIDNLNLSTTGSL